MRKKGYMGVILDGKKLTEICRQIYALQYVNPTAKMSVDDLLLIELAEKDVFGEDRKSTRLNSSHSQQSRMPSSA